MTPPRCVPTSHKQYFLWEVYHHLPEVEGVIQAFLWLGQREIRSLRVNLHQNRQERLRHHANCNETGDDQKRVPSATHLAKNKQNLVIEGGRKGSGINTRRDVHAPTCDIGSSACTMGSSLRTP